jgi:hypothetical protein
MLSAKTESAELRAPPPENCAAGAVSFFALHENNTAASSIMAKNPCRLPPSRTTRGEKSFTYMHGERRHVEGFAEEKDASRSGEPRNDTASTERSEWSAWAFLLTAEGCVLLFLGAS